MVSSAVGANGACGAAARAYLRRGWSVVPVWPGGKQPAVAWQDYQHRLPTEAEVTEWYRRWPAAGVGVITGYVSGLVVLDVDVGHGGGHSLRRLTARHGPLPPTVAARSGGGGTHVYFAHPEFETVRNRAGLRPGLDLRGDGGFVVAPPSRHPSGTRYAWLPGQGPEDRLPAPLPGWLLTLVRGGRGVRLGHPPAHWRALVTEGVAEGTRNTTIASLAGKLLWHGLDPDVVTELLLCWNRVRCRPPLSDAEVVRTVDSITRTHLHGDE